MNFQIEMAHPNPASFQMFSKFWKKKISEVSSEGQDFTFKQTEN